MSRLIIAGVAAIAAATLAPQAPVMAQNGESASSTITVTAPGVRQMRTDNKSTRPDRMVVAQAVVYTNDLDLRTQYGRDVLDSRVRVAAEQTCDQLDRVAPSPVARLNRAIAVAEVDGPQVALADVEPLAEPLAGYHLFHAVRSDLLSRLGQEAEAVAALETALEVVGNDAERALLERRLAEARGRSAG